MTTPQDRAEHLNLTPYKCYHCEGLIGITSPYKLYIGAASFPKSITIQCVFCDRYTYWKPDIDREDAHKINALNK